MIYVPCLEEKKQQNFSDMKTNEQNNNNAHVP